MFTYHKNWMCPALQVVDIVLEHRLQGVVVEQVARDVLHLVGPLPDSIVDVMLGLLLLFTTNIKQYISNWSSCQ